ncbi:hypothetical protein EVAR_79478_1 [Eumeta japonica]|uniref:Uncharacterized protein n=1 Tax=Eumeta variegata TaxID=151549 RepID=A0A4C1UE06_EUMVA|nr:hypothetical protein EVAR_79478_1 [Eumeta japonica]
METPEIIYCPERKSEARIGPFINTNHTPRRYRFVYDPKTDTRASIRGVFLNQFNRGAIASPTAKHSAPSTPAQDRGLGERSRFE